VGEVIKKFRADSDGAFLQLKYVQVSDQYYEHWLATTGGGNQLHHLCAHSLRSCQRKTGKDGLVHIRKWVPISSAQVAGVTKNWKTKPLNHGPPVPPRGVYPVEARQA
jgi:hypothetical protein